MAAYDNMVGVRVVVASPHQSLASIHSVLSSLGEQIKREPRPPRSSDTGCGRNLGWGSRRTKP